MNKDELIARLTELGKKLNREVILTGSKEDLTLRVSELEEELDDDDGEEDTGTPPLKPIEGIPHQQILGKTGQNTASGELVFVETLVTLHIDALHANRNENLKIVEPGVVIRVSQQDADGLIELGLAREH